MYPMISDGHRGVYSWIFFSLFCVSSVGGQVFFGGVEAAGNTRPVLFILDASGSMAENFQGVPRIVAARVMLQEQLARLDPSVPVGLVAYGNRIPGCSSSRLYNAISLGNRSGVMLNVNKMFPAGNTPLAATLNLVARSMIQRHPETTVIVISDGAESCGGNPAAEASLLRSKGIDVRVHVIGLNVDADTARQLGDVARSGNGQYYDVHNHSDFENAIQSTVTERGPVASGPAPLVAKAPAHAVLKLNAIQLKNKTDTHAVYAIDYEFQAPGPGQFHIQFLPTTAPVAPGVKSRIEPIQASPPGSGRSLYNLAAEKGSILLEIPLANLTGGPIFVQGELWDTYNVPIRLGASNSLRTP